MAADDMELGDRSVADLLRQASDQTATLVRQELELAKAELTVKGKRVGLGAGMFGGAGLFGVYALGALTAAIILALSLAMTGWLADELEALGLPEFPERPARTPVRPLRRRARTAATPRSG